MTDRLGRAEFFEQNPQARAWAALAEATDLLEQTTPGPVRIPPERFSGKRAVIIGAGIAGLTTAYEMLAQRSGMKVTVLEALSRTGGRCLTLRDGDELTEDEDSKVFDSRPGETQVVRFDRPAGDSEPYLNAGPGRIPTSHKRVLAYMKLLGVAAEVYVMNSGANLVQMEGGPFDSEPMVYRRLDHNLRGRLAQMVYENAADLLESAGIEEPLLAERTEQLEKLMITFGELIAKGDDIGKYEPTAGQPGLENDRARAGFAVLPGVDQGVIAEALSLDQLLESQFWSRVRFYQPIDWLWQATMVQPVGGMDMIEKAFVAQVETLGGTIHRNSPVQSVKWDEVNNEYVVQAKQPDSEELVEYRADYCFSNVPVPFLSRILSGALQDPDEDGGFPQEFKNALHAVYDAQFRRPVPAVDPPPYVARFLADTTKVGWQADRSLWQGTPIGTPPPSDGFAEGRLSVPDSEVGVVPIFGGISWTSHDIVQVWYPSDAFHDRLGVLTGAYNFSANARAWGEMTIEERLERAREGARRFGKEFGDGLDNGVAIAWQNMPYMKGGWVQWHVVEDAVEHFNVLDQGAGVGGADPSFFVIGDQISSLPGWQEGAIASALSGLKRMVEPEVPLPLLEALPDTRLMVEGI